MARARIDRADHQHHVLVIEDDFDLLDAMVVLLRTAGYGAIGAANGQEALDLLRTTSSPCLILLDLLLPIMDGWEFRTRQLDDPKLARIPIIVCSGQADVANAESLGARLAVKKPLDLPALLELIETCCAQEQVARA